MSRIDKYKVAKVNELKTLLWISRKCTNKFEFEIKTLGRGKYEPFSKLFHLDIQHTCLHI